MQIRAITVNAANTMSAQNVQANSAPAQANNNMLTPHYKVTISKEGKKLSRQQDEQSQGSTKDAAVQRMMLRQIEASERSEKTVNEYHEQLSDIEKRISSLNGSFKAEADKDTIQDELDIIRYMREQKQTQLEENQKRAQQARELAAMQTAKYQDDIDGNNRKLWTLLKTLEEAEKAEEERAGNITEDESAGSTPAAESSVGDMIQNSASQFAVNSMKRDLYVHDKLEEFEDEGHRLVDFANEITGNILKESEKLRTAIDDERYTDEMKAEMVNHFKEQATPSYDIVKKYRKSGLHILQEARDDRVKRLADNPLGGMQETKDSMMMSAADAVLGEARQSRLDEASKELEEQVQKLIDERNSLERTQEEKEEEAEEKEEKIEDLKDLTDTEPGTEKEEDEKADILEELI